MATLMVETQVPSVGVEESGFHPLDSNFTFATDLLFNLDDVRVNCASGLAAHANLVTMLQRRINLERTYAQELSKMARFSHLNETEHGTMKTAMASLRAQYLNTSVQHQQLANNLEEDVLGPIERMYEYNNARSQSLIRRVNAAKKDIKIHEDVYRKDYSAFDRTFREASASFSAAMASGFSSTLLESQYHRRLSQIEDANSSGAKHNSDATASRPDKSSGTVALKTINNNKLVSWLLSSESHRKDDLAKNTVKLMEAAEKARKKCRHSWQVIETQRIKMYRVVQNVLADYQERFGFGKQIAVDRISTIAINLRKHVVFASSSLANEQYDWQVVAPKFEAVDVKSDIHDYICATRGNKGHAALTVNDMCNDTTRALISSPLSKPCRPLRKTRLEIRDIASKKIPFDYDGNQALLSEVLGASDHRGAIERQTHQRFEVQDHEPVSREDYARLRVDCSVLSTGNNIAAAIEVPTSTRPTCDNEMDAGLKENNSVIQQSEPEHDSDENSPSVSTSTSVVHPFSSYNHDATLDSTLTRDLD